MPSPPQYNLLYILPAYPVLSETFVRREIDALRARRHGLLTVGLRPASAPGTDHTLYNSRLPLRLLIESVLHPLCSVRTLTRVATDILFPGEPTPLRIRLKLLPQALAAIALAPIARRSNTHLLRAHFAHAPATVAMYTAHHLGLPFSFTGHANDLFARRSLLRRKLERAAFTACISHEHRRLYADLARVPTPRLPLIRCGVPIPSNPPQAITPGFHLLTLARLVPKKGIDLLIRAAQLAATVTPGLSLTIAGDGPELSRLQALARQTPHLPIRFLGAVAPDAVPDLMRTAHLFVLPCRTDASGDRDGIPVVLMEAMALALPVVAGDLPAIRELIEHNVSGLILPPEDIPTLARWITQLASDRARLASLGHAGRQRVIEEFSLQANITRLEHAIALSIHRPPALSEPSIPLHRQSAPAPTT